MNKRIATFKLLPVLLLLPLIAIGCDKADNPIAPSGSVLNISANPARIAPNGESSLTITGFRPDGNRLNPGTQVRLSSSLGSLSASVISIGADGFATATLRGDGRVGDATVTATLVPESGEGAGSTVMVNIGSAKPSLIVTPLFTEVDPGDVVPITILARDENGLPMGAGETVQLTASLGTFEVNGSRVTSVKTTSDGRAAVDFRVGNQAGSAEITVILGSSDPVKATITVRDVATSFSLSVDRRNVAQGEKITITVVVFNASGQAARGILVQFNVQRTGGGAVNGTLVPNSMVTTADGVATSTFTYNDTLAANSTFEISATVVIKEPGEELPAPETQTVTITVE